MSNASATARAKQIADGFRRLAGQQKIALQKALGETAIAQAALGIRASRDPYGKPFAPLTSRVGIPLRNTGNNIQRAWTAGQETPVSFVFGNAFKYLATHQYGATIVPVRARWLRFKTEIHGWRKAKKVVIPRRQMVPEEKDGGLGKRWSAAFDRTVRKFVRDSFGHPGNI